MDFFTLFPGLQDWVQNLAGVWPASVIKPSIWMFAVIEAVHLLALAALGGCVLIVNLRLMGMGMTNEAASVVEKNVRPILWGSIAAILITGVAIGMSNAEKLYTSTAFLVKMLSMFAALIFSLGVTNSIAKNDGAITMPAKIAGAIALVLWLLSIYIFGTVVGANPGSFHIVTAAFLIAMLFGSKNMRIVLGGIVGAGVVVIAIVTYLVYDPIENYELVTTINIWSVRTAALLITAAIAYEIFKPAQGEGATPALARLAGLFAILSWVTVAAGGRWIGLS